MAGRIAIVLAALAFAPGAAAQNRYPLGHEPAFCGEMGEAEINNAAAVIGSFISAARLTGEPLPYMAGGVSPQPGRRAGTGLVQLDLSVWAGTEHQVEFAKGLAVWFWCFWWPEHYPSVGYDAPLPAWPHIVIEEKVPDGVLRAPEITFAETLAGGSVRILWP